MSNKYKEELDSARSAVGSIEWSAASSAAYWAATESAARSAAETQQQIILTLEVL